MTNYCIYLLLPMGFWTYSNRQIFENHIIPISHNLDIMEHGHTILGSMTRISPGTPFFVILVIHIICQWTFLGKWMKKGFNYMAIKDEDIFYESKAPFFSVVKTYDKQQLLNRDEMLRFVLDIDAFDHKMIHRMFKKTD